VYRAVYQRGPVIGVLVSAQRDLAAARRLSSRALRTGAIPAEVTTGRAAVYPRALAELIPSARAPSSGTRTTWSRPATGE
jgi:transposase, IS6 family